MVVYIRHANDDGKAQKYKHDARITKEGKQNISHIARKLVQKYGYPDKIIFSPFMRCSETVMALVNEIIYLKTGTNPKFCFKCYNHNIQLIRDVSLSRFFTKIDKRNPSVSPSTLKYNIPIYESRDEFKQRVSGHVNRIKKMHSIENIWCITHAIVYKRIAKELGIITPNRIGFLDHFHYK